MSTEETSPSAPSSHERDPLGRFVRQENLTAREMEVLQAMVDGLTSKMIARRIGAAEATVKTHRKAVLRKLGALTSAQAAAIALRQGIVV